MKNSKYLVSSHNVLIRYRLKRIALVHLALHSPALSITILLRFHLSRIAIEPISIPLLAQALRLFQIAHLINDKDPDLRLPYKLTLLDFLRNLPLLLILRLANLLRVLLSLSRPISNLMHRRS